MNVIQGSAVRPVWDPDMMRGLSIMFMLFVVYLKGVATHGSVMSVSGRNTIFRCDSDDFRSLCDWLRRGSSGADAPALPRHPVAAEGCSSARAAPTALHLHIVGVVSRSRACLWTRVDAGMPHSSQTMPARGDPATQPHTLTAPSVLTRALRGTSVPPSHPCMKVEGRVAVQTFDEALLSVEMALRVF